MNSGHAGTARPSAAPRGLTVQAWFMLALTVLGVMTLGAAAVGAALIARSTEAGDHLIDDIGPARAEALKLQAAMLEQETGVRGYLLTGDRALLEPYHRGRVAESSARTRLRDLLGGEPAPAADLTAVDLAVRTWREDFAIPAIAAGKADRAGFVEKGKAAFDGVRERLTSQQRQLDREQAEARTAFLGARTERDRVLLVVLAAFLLTGVALAVLLHFAVVRPLARVRSAARRVAGGSFGHSIPRHGPADVQSLAQAVEAMRLRVVSELAVSRRNEAALSEQTAELDAQAQELQRSNAELEQFAYVASHDLQEPLRKVSSFCQLLEKRYGDQLDERGTQYIAFAVDGAKRMQVLINDLLTFSRVGRLQETEEAVALDGAVERALRNLAAAVEESDAVVDRPEQLPEVMGDPTLLTMLWQNLIGNAIKFRHPDRAPRIRITVDRESSEEGDRWMFGITDNGIGIPAEFAEKVFVIFQRLHGRDSYSGTGIGLSLCKKIVEHGGGRIWIDTAHSGGTRLAFTIPVIASTDTEQPSATIEGSTT
ncbi:ATP-binding protein [Streptomyces sp. NBC_01142]|uniref:sensor histidine kinase n=1 Tax=Streptomyces sp. NBC_01142 TaxID=2975865 RepID=UPI002B1D3F3E|nr:ATP-binding protein [Streptomyces sp. NBC_01142]